MHAFSGLCALFLFLVINTNGQNTSVDSLNGTDQRGVLNRPFLEFGTGPISYFGDVGRQYNKGVHSLVSPFGAHLRLQTPINDFLQLNLYTIFGRMQGNERSPERNLNFQTEIKTGGLVVSYNFNHLINPESIIKPYVSVGVEAFEFLSKADLKDSQGRYYHYWSDGTIRDLPEGEGNENESVLLTRDYSYESDLREQNLDDAGKYPLSSFAIPLGVGFNIRVSEQINFRMGTEFHYTFTDNIDNVSDNGEGIRKGKKGNDHFLYSSFGIAYNLNIPKKGEKKPEIISDPSMYVHEDMTDEDDDGVADIIDLCPFTPANTLVTKFGCPLDRDGDGVPDHLDDEPESAPGAVVNSKGVTLSDEDLELIYLTYIDSLDRRTDRSSAAAKDAVRIIGGRKRIKGYRVMIGSGEEISSQMISKLLSIPDVETMENEVGTTYLVGNYPAIEDAIIRKIQLENEGILGMVVLDEFGNIHTLDEKAGEIERKIRDGEMDEETLAKIEVSNDPLFRVQIGAYRQRLGKENFKNVPDLLIIQGDDGITRYISGSFKTMKEAAEHKVDLLIEGFDGAFITAYRHGKRISLKDAGVEIEGNEGFSSETSNISPEKVSYALQLGAFKGSVPVNILSDYIKLGNVRPVRGADGMNKYIYGKYATAEEAQQAKKVLAGQGYPEAFVVGEVEGKVISLKDAQTLDKK